MVAEHQLQRRLTTIEWEETVLYPALDLVKAGRLRITYTPSDGVKMRELEAPDAG